MNQLGVFAKYWLPGDVKTRLARSIGDQPASQLYRQFVATLLKRFQETADRRIVAYCPAERGDEFAAIAPEDWELAPQSAGDLGQRMHSFFQSHLRRPDDRVVLIGTDSPTIPTDTINEAFEALRSHDVVLGPTRDGGYYLVGAAGHVPPIFANIDWSTPLVWRQTVQRLNQAGRKFAQLPLWYDVDDLNDLQQIADDLGRLQQGDPSWTSLAVEVQSALAHAS